MFGTNTSFDLLATAYNTTVAKFGEDRAFDAIEDLFASWEQILKDQIDIFADTTQDRLRRYGTPATMTSEEFDEFGSPDVQKVSAGSTVGFPLRRFGMALGWNRLYMVRATGAEMAAQVKALLTADYRRFVYELQSALYLTNNYTFRDRLVDHVDLPVKRLVNADSMSLPIGPNGETYNAATHNHYLGRVGGAVADSDLILALETVLEHANAGQAMILINRAEEAAIRTFTANFVAYPDPRVVYGVNTAVGAGKTLDNLQLYNRAIGVYRGAEVWVKPWVPAGYITVVMTGTQKVLGRRIDPVLPASLQLEFDDENHPIRAKGWFRHFGFGVQNRVGAAVLYTGNTSYTAPTLTF